MSCIDRQQGMKFDLQRAYSLALAAELAYVDAIVAERTAVDQWGMNQFEFIDVDETQCFVAANDAVVIVSFRGTESNKITDWITDLNFDLVDGPLGGKVHEGFFESLSNVWKMLDELVRTMQDTERKTLWVTGHSMGAALATLAVARWREVGYPVAGLCSFGQPRTGDCAFSRNFDFEFKPYTFRLVNNHDIVTRIPPRVLGYRHTGSFRYFNATGELFDHIQLWRTFLRGWHGDIKDILTWAGHGVKDHSMSLYRQKIEGALCQTRDLPTFPNTTHPTSTESHAPIQPRRRAA